jgi:hypothetical protein
MLRNRKQRARLLLRSLFLALLAIALLGILAPFIDASRFTGAIQRNLEASLGRRVEFTSAHFTLFTGPGFTLDDVTIQEDPRYGVEPFAHATSLDAHLRIDKLLRGQIRFSSLRLVEPSLNLTKRSDGTWNIVELVGRLAAPRRAPLNLFPAFEIADGGRINFKFGTRKTTFYIADVDLTMYPQRSRKLYFRFSGSPARSDRAGNGFGHLHGTANWYLSPPRANSNQLEADITIEPSNLAELTTLFEGYDLGVHGTARSHFRIEGPATALRIAGDLQFMDVHRWDLLPSSGPSSGQDWRIRYRGALDLLAHTLQLETIPARSGETPAVALEVRVNNFLVNPAWSVVAAFNGASARDLLPLAKRMGLAIPDQLALEGALNGAIGYSNRSGFAGGLSIKDAVVTLPNLPPLRTALAAATIAPDRIHLDPAIIQTSSGGTLRAGGDYFLSAQRLVASLTTDDFSLDSLKSTADSWFGAPPAFALLRNGTITGRFTYAYDPKHSASWSGQFQFADMTLRTPELALPLVHAQGRVTFDDSTLNMDRFLATINDQKVYATYRYNAAAKRAEHLHIELPSADLAQLEAALDPTLRSQNLLARLRLTHPSIPAWLAERNLDGDLTVAHFSANGVNLGPLSCRFTWQGPAIQFASVKLNLREGLIRAHGSLNLASYAPQYRFNATATAFPWRDGLLGAEAELVTAGTGLDLLQNLRVSGTFSGQDVQLSSEDSFNTIAGNFDLSFAAGWPDLRLSGIEASDSEDEWTGQAATQSDGKLILDLEHDGHQRRVVSTLTPQSPSPATLTTALPR